MSQRTHRPVHWENVAEHLTRARTETGKSQAEVAFDLIERFDMRNKKGVRLSVESVQRSISNAENASPAIYSGNRKVPIMEKLATYYGWPAGKLNRLKDGEMRDEMTVDHDAEVRARLLAAIEETDAPESSKRKWRAKVHSEHPEY